MQTRLVGLAGTTICFRVSATAQHLTAIEQVSALHQPQNVVTVSSNRVERWTIPPNSAAKTTIKILSKQGAVEDWGLVSLIRAASMVRVASSADKMASGCSGQDWV